MHARLWLDFDGDDRLSPNDLRELINRLTSYKDKDMDEDRTLEEESVEHLIEQVRMLRPLPSFH